jgi:radical SAM protein (TIGR01212 family)
LGEKRYYRFSEYLKRVFGLKVYKVSLDAGFTCPNRDGKKGFGGCMYCVNESFSPNAGRPISIGEQMRRGMEFMRSRYRAEKFIAYFQAFTNTYADVETLRRCYEEALRFPDVVGLSIGTRPDCVPDDVLDLIRGYASRCHVWVEYGLQSMHDATLDFVNRGHHYGDFVDAVRRTRERGINVCAHVILGLPGESREDMMETARGVSSLGVEGIKLHHLYVARHTPLETLYRLGKIDVLSHDEYIELAADFLERISPDITIQRLVGDVTSDMLVAPKWPVSKEVVLRGITEELVRRKSCQGAKEEMARAIRGSA